MKFSISRTSDWDNLKPCEEAFSEKTIHHEKWSDISVEGYKEEYGVDWFTEGKNHSNNERTLERDIEVDNWFIKFKDFEELSKFTEKYGSVIVNKNSIEIYDDYRE